MASRISTTTDNILDHGCRIGYYLKEAENNKKLKFLIKITNPILSLIRIGDNIKELYLKK
ncbi:MAG: hypothetical protein QMD02_06970 [Bacteroidales bacterium]|nr:hypothetical protein [Bacteroidales bacterium]